MARDKEATLKKIQEAWDNIIKNDRHPTMAEFARVAGVGTSTIYHNYPEWAKQIQKRRDKKHGKRKASPVTKSREKESLKAATEQIKLLQIENHRLTTSLEDATKEIGKLRLKVQKFDEIEKQNQFLLGGFDYLIDQLIARGMTKEKVDNIWGMFEKHILPVKGEDAKNKRI
ncbi:hypothetical protein [Bacillus massilinigeriensis]|uniref:hypothetical protein n=1 Tax=Bacillus massilionigeriensis TaxID=1805475 RepID=UPI00096B06DD|nr:hypothetical protein [Bacillus massilionigeriensis]